MPAGFEANMYKNMKGLYKLEVMITAEKMYKTTFDGKLENPVFIADSNVTTKMFLNGAGRAEFNTPSTSGLIMSPECVNVVRGVKDL